MPLAISPAEIAIYGPITVESIQRAFRIGRAMASINYASLTIVFWDMFLTVPMEVRLLWGTKLSLLKVLFLFNRYVAPLVLAVNIYFASGLFRGLTDELCRGWLTFSTVYEIFSMSSVSFLYAFRLWAWYEMSTRTLSLLLGVWAISLLTSLGFFIELAGVHNKDFIHEPALNVCITVTPIIWPQWVSPTLEHGIYAVFLLSNAMSTPRSEQKPALAVLYRDGILFYILTFFVCLGSLMTWSVAPRLYVSLGLYPPWAIFQVGISRLLLNVKNSQLFATRERTLVGGVLPVADGAPSEVPLKDMASTHGTRRTSYIVVQGGEPAISAKRDDDQESGKHEEYITHNSKTNFHTHGEEQDETDSRHVNGKSSSVGREIRRIHSGSGSWRKRFWWLFGKAELVDIHIDVLQIDSEEDQDAYTGGVRESRLGRLDAYL